MYPKYFIHAYQGITHITQRFQLGHTVVFFNNTFIFLGIRTIFMQVREQNPPSLPKSKLKVLKCYCIFYLKIDHLNFHYV